jgi:hypothetical protein
MCGHRLCELIGGDCSLVVTRSRGCTPLLAAREISPELLDEVRELLGRLDLGVSDDRTRADAVRLAGIMRREALENRPLLAQLRIHEPELVPALERLCARPRA